MLLLVPLRYESFFFIETNLLVYFQMTLLKGCFCSLAYIFLQFVEYIFLNRAYGFLAVQTSVQNVFILSLGVLFSIEWK